MHPSSSPRRKEAQRSLSIDFLRGIAIILVMFRHGMLSPFTTQIGWMGVDLFFVLSGFLVSGLLFVEFQHSQQIKPLRFLARRGFKIYPLFYFMLIVYLLYNYMKHTFPPVGNILAEVFFYQNYHENIMNISWSLAVEEHFYILLAVLLFYASRKMNIATSKIIPYSCLAVAAICLTARIITAMYTGPAMKLLLFPTHLRIDSLAFGVLLSWLFHFRHESLTQFTGKNKTWMAIMVPFLLSPAFIFIVDTSVFLLTVGLSMLMFAFGITLILSVMYEPRSVGKYNLYRAVAWIGKFSYAIYLVHILAGPFFANQIDVRLFNSHLSNEMRFVLSFIFNVAAGFVLTRLIEWPMLKLRNRLLPSNANAVATS